MISASAALSAIPNGLRDPLLSEYRSIVQNFMERKWSPSELSGGKFCEVVYWILRGYGDKSYAASPSKPANFVDACRLLENNTSVPRSFQILVPRLLPALYEIRNNRGVGHVGGDVDPNHMDATAVISMANWVMAELVRVFHNLPVAEAQSVVDALAERRIPLVWEGGDMKRVLDPKIKMREQVLILVASASGEVQVEDVVLWVESKKRQYFNELLAQLHSERLVEVSGNGKTIQILPPGSAYVAAFIASRRQD